MCHVTLHTPCTCMTTHETYARYKKRRYLRDIPVQQLLMHVLIFFFFSVLTCFNIWFFINHAWGIGARALNMCNYTCRDMHSPLHVVRLHKKRKKSAFSILCCLCNNFYIVGQSHTCIINVEEYTHKKNVFSEHHLENAFSNSLCILLPRKTMICTPRANIHLCMCKQVQTCISVYKKRLTIHNYPACNS